jgi:hypothetical protein
VISYVVAQRGHEMGVRPALGATTGQLVGSVVRQDAVLAAIGVAIGVAGAFGLTRVMTAFMFGVSPTDPLTFTLAAALLLGVALVATLLPRCAWSVSIPRRCYVAANWPPSRPDDAHSLTQTLQAKSNTSVSGVNDPTTRGFLCSRGRAIS